MLQEAAAALCRAFVANNPALSTLPVFQGVGNGQGSFPVADGQPPNASEGVGLLNVPPGLPHTGLNLPELQEATIGTGFPASDGLNAMEF